MAEEREVSELIDKLTKPMFVWRFANARLGYDSSDSPRARGARTTKLRAELEIRDIVKEWSGG